MLRIFDGEVAVDEAAAEPWRARRFDLRVTERCQALAIVGKHGRIEIFAEVARQLAALDLAARERLGLHSAHDG